MNENQMKIEERKNNEKEKNNYPVNGYYRPFLSLFNDFFGGDETTDVMKTDITETEEGYQLEVEVPGVDKSNIRLSLDKGYLSISAKVSKTENYNHKKVLRSERYYGSFSRSFYLGNNVKREDISATSNNGILIITIKKPVETKQEEKFIEIK